MFFRVKNVKHVIYIIKENNNVRIMSGYSTNQMNNTSFCLIQVFVQEEPAKKKFLQISL